jgi:hypothetical protein
MSGPQEQAWLSLMTMTELVPTGWCLVGGQMVHLHCAERGVFPNRPTDDGDAVLDVRAQPDILVKFTEGLVALGFTSTGVSMQGHEHRWVEGDADEQAQIDVLIPGGLGEPATVRKGATGSTTLETPGAQQALDRSELVAVEVAGTAGRASRPNLVGALVIKAAAYSVSNDRYRSRHLIDLVVLGTMIRRSDDFALLTNRDRRHLRAASAALRCNRATWAGVTDGDRGVDVLEQAIETPAARPDA